MLTLVPAHPIGAGEQRSGQLEAIVGKAQRFLPGLLARQGGRLVYLQGDRRPLMRGCGHLQPEALKVLGRVGLSLHQTVRTHLLQGGPGQDFTTLALQAFETARQRVRGHAFQAPGQIQVAIHPLEPPGKGLQTLLERSRVAHLEPHVPICADLSILGQKSGLRPALAVEELETLSLDAGQGRAQSELVQLAQALFVDQRDGSVGIAGHRLAQVVARVGQGVVSAVRTDLLALGVVVTHSPLGQGQQPLGSRALRGRQDLLEDSRFLQILQGPQGERLQPAGLNAQLDGPLQQLLGGLLRRQGPVARPEGKKGLGGLDLSARLHHVANELLRLLATLRGRGDRRNGLRPDLHVLSAYVKRPNFH